MISEQEIESVREPPGRPMGKVAELWKPVEGTNKIVCTACARYCKIGEGQVGLCGVRGVHDGKLWLYVYGRVITGHVDPIEKKPVSHFRPGSKIFSIATTGCNWLCHPAGTPILMADGTTKAVEEIRAGDALWSVADHASRTVPAVVTEAGSRKATTYRMWTDGLRDPLLATGEHPVLTPRGWVPLARLIPGDWVLTSRRGEDGPVTLLRDFSLPAHAPVVHPKETSRFWHLLDAHRTEAPGLTWGQVRSVREEASRERVYSFESVPFHNYIASETVVHNCRYCFLPGTRILTEKGHVPIQSIFAEASATTNPELRVVTNRTAFTHKGRWRRITKAFQHLYSGPVLSIRPYYLPPVECTPDHRVYASIAGGPVRKVRASELQVGDFVALPRPRKRRTLEVDVPSILASAGAPASKDRVALRPENGWARWPSGSSSVSPMLPYGVAQLLLSPGDMPRLYEAPNPSEYGIEGRSVSRSDDCTLGLWADDIDMTPAKATRTSSKIRVVRTEDYVLVPIRSVSEREYVGPVYNIEVQEDHSYTTNLMAVANCQNADISQRRKVEGIEVEPHDVVRMTLDQGCQGLAYTYNQPTIFIEFARDIGILARQAGLINIFVSNGYDTPETVAEMPKFLDCVTVDFKGSGETGFVRKYINIPNADPIFQTILDMRDTKKIHIEITDLIVPQVGDSLDAARHLSKWVYDHLGPDTPIHFLRFHPDYKMMEFPWTPVETLEKHCAVAKEVGLKYVYVGNVPGHPLEHTYCPGCGTVVVKRYGFDITGWYLDKDNKCKKCGYQIAIVGRLEKTAKENRFYGVLYHH